jgi:DNA-binding NarL/FixJ family response regulator
MKKQVSVAIADDHSLLREGLANLLCQMNYTIAITAPNGRELLDQLYISPSRPDVCIIDINMPLMNGFETCSELKAHFPGIKIISFSMSDNPILLDRMKESGADKVLLKGEPPEMLFKSIDELVSKCA